MSAIGRGTRSPSGHRLARYLDPRQPEPDEPRDLVERLPRSVLDGLAEEQVFVLAVMWTRIVWPDTTSAT